MPPIPDNLNLQTIAHGAGLLSQPLRDNYSSIQTEFNKLVTILSGGNVGQYLKKDGANSASWSDPNVNPAPAGTVILYGGSNAPPGWLLCDGSAVSRTVYSALFNAIGTTYGSGDGSTTFNLPDMRGRMVVGRGTHADVDALGDNEGASLASRRPGHTHQASITNNVTRASGAGGALSAMTVTSTVGTPPYLVLNYIIKT